MNTETDQQTDPMTELTAMSDVAKALQPLDEQSIRRVLQWAADRFGAAVSVVSDPSSAANANVEEPFEANPTLDAVESFETIADLYAAAAPRNDPEKALIVAYWFQKLGNQPDFDSASVNRELKHLGHGISNITVALNSLMGRKPQLVIQTRKSGSSQQARKKYKLTGEGLSFAERKLRGED